MSEYQYYDFRAVDKPLTGRQQGELRDLSTRAEITDTEFTNTYDYGDFRGDTDDMMERYFDAFLYLANWGTRQLAFRFPKTVLDLETAKRYCHTDATSVIETDEYVILNLDFDRDEADDEWLEVEERIDDMLPARAAVAGGDLRLLYLAWLYGIQWADDNVDNFEDEPEPPVPAGLDTLTDALESIVEFLELDDDLLEAAVQPTTAPRTAFKLLESADDLLLTRENLK